MVFRSVPTPDELMVIALSTDPSGSLLGHIGSCLKRVLSESPVLVSLSGAAAAIKAASSGEWTDYAILGATVLGTVVDSAIKEIRSTRSASALREALSGYSYWRSLGMAQSLGSVTAKAGAAKHYEKAGSHVVEMARHQCMPQWIRAALWADLRARKGACHFYAGDLDEAERAYGSAFTALMTFRQNPDVQFMGLSEKLVLLQAFRLSNQIAMLADGGESLDQIEEKLESFLDRRLVSRARASLTEGAEHNPVFAAPLARWFGDQVRCGALSIGGVKPEAIEQAVAEGDRAQFVVACSKLVSNWAWTSLYLFARSGADRHLKSALQDYNISMDAVVDGFACPGIGSPRIQRNLRNTYLSASHDHWEVYRVLARESAHRLLACVLSEGDEDTSQDIERLVHLHERSSRLSARRRLVHTELGIAGRNFSRIGLGEAWREVCRILPSGLAASTA